MTWSDSELAALVEPDRMHRKAYTNPEIFELEMERIFERQWISIGNESQVPNPADYHPAQVGRQPMMMTHDHDGGINVLYNRCPHGAAQLCTARKGNAGKLTCCSCRAWTFELDGRLESVPAIKGYDGTAFALDDPEFSLRNAPRADLVNREGPYDYVLQWWG